MKKRIFTLFLTTTMVLSLAACGGNAGESKKTSTAESNAATENKDTADTQKQSEASTETTPPATKADAESTTKAADAADDGEPVELIVFAAASMTETMTEIANLYKAVAPNVTITYNFDSSGTLKTQITEGADCDLFISAAQKQMNQMDAAADAEANPDGLDYIMSDTRIDLLENKVVLVTADNSESGVTSFQDIVSDKLKMLCIGNDDVPVGAYSLKILDYLGTSAADLEAEGKITYGSNVKEVTTQVSEGAVDCGIIYATDAFSAGLTPVDEATAEMCGQVIYPAAVMKNTKHVQAAKDFLEYLQSDEASAVFEKVGFTPLS